MNTNLSSTKKMVRAGGLSFAMTLAMAVVGAGGALYSRPAQAIFCPQCSTWFGDVLQWGKEIARWGKEANSWKSQVDSLKNQIASVQNMLMTLGLQPGPEMEEVPLNYNVAERCGGFNLSSLTTVFNINGSGDIYQQQKQVCANIQMMQNTKYNETVRFLRTSADEMRNDFNTLRNTQASANNVGNSNKAAQDADAAMYKQEARFKDWQSKMTAYDAYIGTMKENQRLLAQIAMKGSRTNQVLGQIGRTAIMETALSN